MANEISSHIDCIIYNCLWCTVNCNCTVLLVTVPSEFLTLGDPREHFFDDSSKPTNSSCDFLTLIDGQNCVGGVSHGLIEMITVAHRMRRSSSWALD